MKKLALIAVSGLVALASCKEVGPSIEKGRRIDTSYTAAVETPQPRTVLIEEFTGVTCANCPSGHQTIEGIEATYKALEIRVYPFYFGQANPVPNVTKEDFRTQKGTDLGQYFGGISFMPSAVIDRVPQGTQIMTSASLWPGLVQARSTVPSPLNLYVTSTYNASLDSAYITVKVAMTQAVNKKLNLTVAIVQDSIVDAQEYPSYIDTNYTHMAVLRDFITDYSGSEILTEDATKAPGRVYIRYFNYALNPAWIPEHCRVIAWISNNEGTDIEVSQAAEAHLK